RRGSSTVMFFKPINQLRKCDGEWFHSRTAHYEKRLFCVWMCSNDDGFLRAVHVPEDSLAVLIESSCRDDTGDIRARQPDAVIPAACRFRVSPDTRYMNERDFEAALERPELVSAPDVQHQLAFG